MSARQPSTYSMWSLFRNSFCFRYGRPCPYFTLCRSGGSPNVLENFYERRPPHEELRDVGDSPGEEPVF